MVLWLILAAMVALTLGLLLPTLLRRPTAALAREDFDTEIYRDQLGEIERDAVRGLIEETEAEVARAEVSRRLLATEARRSGEQPPSGIPVQGTGRVAAVVVAVLVPVAALALYLTMGSPVLIDRVATTTPSSKSKNSGAGPDMAPLVGRLAEKLKQRPDDAIGWSLYARSLARLGRYEEAVPAFRRAARLTPDDAALRLQFAEALIFATGGRVTPEARAALEATLAIAPGEPRVRYYLGLAERQAGRRHGALQRWLALQADSSANAPWRSVLDSRIEKLAADLGIDAAGLATMQKAASVNRPAFTPKSAPKLPPAPGPSAEDVAAARNMSEGDRGAMIRTMVARLADRLREQPGDGPGWRRLGRSYGVLGEHAKSRDAYAKAAKLLPDDVAVLGEYAGALIKAAGDNRILSPELVRVTREILKRDADNRSALWMAGLAQQQVKDATGAGVHWRRLLGLLAPGTPQHEQIKKLLGELAPN